MKKSIIIGLLFVLIPVAVWAWGIVVVSMNAASAADTTAPTLSSASIGTNGTTLTLGFSEAVTRGAGYANADWDFNDGSDVGMTYSSGDGTNTWTMTVPTVHSGDTVTLDWAGTANGVEDGAANDLASINAQAITNNSTQSAGTYYYQGGTSDVYTSTDNHNCYEGHRHGDKWTPGVTKSITKIGFKATGYSHPVTLALWTVSGSTYTLVACKALASPTTGWNDVTLDTPYSLGASTKIAITYISSDSDTVTMYYTGATGGVFSAGNTYASECGLSTATGQEDDFHVGVRFYGE